MDNFRINNRPSFASDILSLTEFLDNPTAQGVSISGNEKIDDIIPHLGNLEVICLDFPTFKYGIHYSTAKLLRNRYGFTGEVRATGNILPDQFAAMVDCGFDGFTPDKSGNWDNFLYEMKYSYQRGTMYQKSVFDLRHNR